MVLVKIDTPVHYHVKKDRICKNKICQIPGTFFDGNMLVSAGMAHIQNVYLNIYNVTLTQMTHDSSRSSVLNVSCVVSIFSIPICHRFDVW